jgi:hypothetical protein
MNFFQNEIRRTQTSFSTNFSAKLNFILSFLFPSQLHFVATYIFTAPTYTTSIIILVPCALNAKFQHFILRCNKILTLQIPLKKEIAYQNLPFPYIYVFFNTLIMCSRLNNKIIKNY